MSKEQDVVGLKEGIETLGTKDNDCFRLLDLPKELRLCIYDHVFADSSTDKKIDLFAVRKHLPDPSILRVSQQIRREATTPYEIATRTFWYNHTVSMFVTGVLREIADEEYVEAQEGRFWEAFTKLMKCPDVTIRSVSLKLQPSPVYFGWTINSYNRPYPLIVDVDVDNTDRDIWAFAIDFPDFMLELVGTSPGKAGDNIIAMLRGWAQDHVKELRGTTSLVSTDGGFDLEAFIHAVFKMKGRFYF